MPQSRFLGAIGSQLRRVLALLSNLKTGCLSLLYPPLCLHCLEPLNQTSHILCPVCTHLMEPLDSKGRCPRCFSKNWAPKSRRCHDCSGKRIPFYRMGSVFPCFGPAVSLFRQMEHTNHRLFAESIAAYTVLQWHKLGWELPDLVTYVPLVFERRLAGCFDGNRLVALKLASFLNASCVDLLFSDASSTYQFRSKYRDHVQDKVVLIIDGITSSGNTMNKCGEALLSGWPRLIYGLTFLKKESDSHMKSEKNVYYNII